MIGLDSFIILLKLIVLFIYGSIFIISIIFTFSIDTYNRIDELLNMEFLSQQIMNPLERNINLIDDWLIAHNKIIGPMLIFISLSDIVLLYKVIDLL